MLPNDSDAAKPAADTNHFDQYYEHYIHTEGRVASREAQWQEFKRVFEDYVRPLRLKPRDVVLDVGSGLGVTARYLSALGIRTVNLEVSAYALQRGKQIWRHGQQLGLRSDATPGIPLRDNSVDAVISQDLLEHLQTEEQLHALMVEFGRVCKPHGMVFGRRRMVHNVTVLEDTENIHRDPTHHIKWSVKEWDAFFELYGFQRSGPSTQYFVNEEGKMGVHRHGHFVLQPTQPVRILDRGAEIAGHFLPLR